MQEILNQYPPITLEQMSAVKLLNRIDTKYVTTVDRLFLFLEEAKDQYYVQDYYGQKLMPYHTIYLDTPGLDMYMAHQDGKKHRYKVRMRMYENDGTTFIEVKNKSNKGRTKKKRIEIPGLEYEKGEMREFVSKHVPYDVDTLSPTIENHFNRITLVNKGKTERLTIDVNLKLHNLLNNNTKLLDGYTIIELKREGMIESPAIGMLRDLRIEPCGFSKMALGMAMTSPDLKQNMFKMRIHQIEKMAR